MDQMDGKNMPMQMILLHSAHLLKYQAFSVLEKIDMNPGQVGILFILNRYGSMSQRQLARKAGITPPSMTAAVKKMEEKGYVLKEPDPNDQRKQKICLTDKGRDSLDDLLHLFRHMESVMLTGFRTEEKMLLRRFLLQIEDNILHSKEMENTDQNEILKKMYSQHTF